jgi:hypothetical protein
MTVAGPTSTGASTDSLIFSIFAEPSARRLSGRQTRR